MKIAILGSTGFVGKTLLTKALESGYAVKVLARNPNKLGALKDRVEIVAGSYFDADKVKRTVSGTEVVLSAIGASAKDAARPEEYENAMAGLLSVMKQEGLKRIIWIGGAATPIGANEKFGFRRAVLRMIVNLMGRHLIRIKRKEGEVLVRSDLDWVIIRPPRVVAGTPTGKVIADEHNLASLQIDVQDLVAFMLGQITSNRWIRKAPLIASG